MFSRIRLGGENGQATRLVGKVMHSHDFRLGVLTKSWRFFLGANSTAPRHSCSLTECNPTVLGNPHF